MAISRCFCGQQRGLPGVPHFSSEVGGIAIRGPEPVGFSRVPPV